MASGFNEWLSHRLQDIGLDGEVMSSYIASALEQDSEDKLQCTCEILNDFTVGYFKSCKDLLLKI